MCNECICALCAEGGPARESAFGSVLCMWSYSLRRAKMAQQRTRRFLSAYVQTVTDAVGV